ncbi:MAG: MATE family efflux transporter [Planctomycetota bacterium]
MSWFRNPTCTTRYAGDVLREASNISSSTPDTTPSFGQLTKRLLVLGLPIAVENLLHIFVGLTDTYLANQLDKPAAAAVGATTYVLWFIGLMTGSVATGSTALISRATGANDRRTANAATGQSFLLAGCVGLVLATLLLVLAGPAGRWFGLENPETQAYITQYLWILGFGVPLAVFTFVGNACLRGAGDTLTPAIAMIVIDLVNIGLSFGLVYGWGPLPAMGFDGIAWGTAIAYSGGAFVVAAVLLRGSSTGLKLYLHRLRPHVSVIRRVLKVGLPSMFEGLTFWGANFVVLYLVGTLGDVAGAAHNVVVRVEALSYMTGFAISTAAATMVGQALGRRNPTEAMRSGTVAFVVGGGFMVGCGVLFVAVPHFLCGLIASEPEIVEQSAKALRVVGFAQIGFAAMMIYGGALRGAGDTTAVMTRNLGSAIVLRMTGALLVVNVFDFGLIAVWAVLAIDLMSRGLLLAGRFYSGKWTTREV